MRDAVCDLSNEELFSKLRATSGECQRLSAQVIECLIEVEERSLHLHAGYESMFAFCTRGIGMSGGAAFRRINAARLAKRFPMLLDHIEHGTLHLSTLVLLRPYLTEQNVEELVAETAGKSRREVEAIIARRWPRADVRASLRKLPDGMNALAEDRHKLTVTISGALRAKIERSIELMRHRNPSGDLEILLESAIDALLGKLEKELLKKTDRAHRHRRPAQPGHITAAATREVFARDGEQCTFTSESGVRCQARGWLQLDHKKPRGDGGGGEPNNIRILCAAHNRLHAEATYGREYIAQKILARQRHSEAIHPQKEP